MWYNVKSIDSYFQKTIGSEDGLVPELEAE